MALTVLDKIEIAKISQYLSNVSTAKSGLFGPKPDQQLPEKLYLERKAVEWEYDGEGLTDGTRAAGTITVTSLGNTGDRYLFTYDYPGIGVVTLGEYETQSSDTTTAILAASIASELNDNTYGFTFTVTNSTINYLGPLGLGASANGTAISCTYTEQFLPTNISDLWAWWDAAQGVTGTTSVTQWNDLSGNGNTLTADSGEFPAVFNNAQNGKPAIGRSGGNARLDAANLVPDLAVQGGTIFIVAKQINTSDTNGPFLFFGTTQSVNIRRGGAAADYIRFGVTSQSGATSNNRIGFPDNVFYSLRLRVDNVNQYASINNDTETSVPCVLGDYSGGTILSLFWSVGNVYGNKQICEVIFYDRDLNETEINEVETYLNDKYALY